MNISKLVGLAAILMLPSMAAHAAPVFEVTDNPGGQNLPDETVNNGGTYSTQLQIFDSLSISTDSAAQSTTGNLNFTFAPSPQRARLTMILSSTDFDDFGDVTVTLSDMMGNMASDTITMAGQEINFFADLNSPLNIKYEWEKLTTGSFNSDLHMAPIPLPAGVVLLLGALGGLGLIRRMASA